MQAAQKERVRGAKVDGQAIARFRKEKMNWTQEQLAAATGLSVGAIQPRGNRYPSLWSSKGVSLISRASLGCTRWKYSPGRPARFVRSLARSRGVQPSALQRILTPIGWRNLPQESARQQAVCDLESSANHHGCTSQYSCPPRQHPGIRRCYPGGCDGPPESRRGGRRSALPRHCGCQYHQALVFTATLPRLAPLQLLMRPCRLRPRFHDRMARLPGRICVRLPRARVRIQVAKNQVHGSLAGRNNQCDRSTRSGVPDYRLLAGRAGRRTTAAPAGYNRQAGGDRKGRMRRPNL